MEEPGFKKFLHDKVGMVLKKQQQCTHDCMGYSWAGWCISVLQIFVHTTSKAITKVMSDINQCSLDCTISYPMTSPLLLMRVNMVNCHKGKYFHHNHTI